MKDFFILKVDKNYNHDLIIKENNIIKSNIKEVSFSTEFFNVSLNYENDKNLISNNNNDLYLLILGPIPYLKRGEILKKLLENFEIKGPETINELKNHFFIILIDKKNEQIHLFTDKVTSNKVLLFNDKETLILTNNIFFIPQKKINPNLASIGSFLINDGLINTKTLIENVNVLEPGSYYNISLKNNELSLTTKRYWSLNFTNEFKGKSEKELRQELSKVLISAVEDNLPINGNIYLSLSAGYDSSSIFAILSKILNVKNINAFTYKFGKIKKDGDEYLAGEIARLYKQPHKILESFNGDLLQVIEDNANHINGFSNTCGESDVWVNFELDEKEINYIFVGDQFFGYLNNYKAKDIFDMLNAHLLYNFDILPFKKGYIKDEFLENMISQYNTDLEEFVEKLPNTEDPDILDTIYFNYRLINKITPWRQNFTGLKFVVLNPFISDYIIDFMSKVPGQIRNHKKLFQDTVREMFPELFAIKRATSINVGNYWEIYLDKQKDEIIRYLNNSSSILDNIIDKNEIIKMINNYNYIFSFENIKKYSIENAKRILRKFKFGDKIIKKYKTKKSLILISKATFLRRYLILRRFYEKF